LINITRKI